MVYSVVEVPKQTVYGLIKRNHYLKRLPPISFAFSLYDNLELKGVCTFGVPAGKDLCVGLCGEKYKDEVLELNRLFLIENKKNLASFFVAKCLKMLPPPKIIVSYADTSVNHHGYIYQATNFIYTGLSAKRRDTIGVGHSRTIKWDGQNTVERPRKHRYVYFVGNKKEKKERKNNLLYPIVAYPKGNNDNYKIGDLAPTQALLI